VVDEIYVTDGAKVKQGDLLIELDPSVARAQLSQFVARSQTLEARKSRYEAEQAGQAPTFGYSPNADASEKVVLRGGQTIVDENAAASEATNQAVIDQQRIEYEAGRKRLQAQTDALNFKIETFKDQRSGLRARMVGGQKLLDLTARDLRKVRPLAEDG